MKLSENFIPLIKSRSKAAIDKRIDIRSQSAPLSTDPVLEELGAWQALDCVEQLALLNHQIRSVEKQIKSTFKAHPDCELFSGLPGAGEALAPRLAAAFGSDRSRFETPQQLQVYAGIAPIEVKSGNKHYTFMRQRCPKFIRQSFHEWAGLTIQNSKWAHAFYQLKLEQGMRKAKAKRALAFKWIRILHRCWTNHQLYDENKYVQVLIKRQSPVVHKMKQLGLIDEQNNLLFT